MPAKKPTKYPERKSTKRAGREKLDRDISGEAALK